MSMLKRSALFVLLSPAVWLSATDLKIVTADHIKGSDGLVLLDAPEQTIVAPEMTLYVHGQVQRVEFLSLPPTRQKKVRPQRVAIITHCDTGEVYQLNLDAHEYMEYKLDRYPNPHKFARQVAHTEKEDRKHAQFEIRDTGETRDFHGLVARHWMITIKGKDKEQAYQKTIDGWYLQQPTPGCAPEYIRQHHGGMTSGISMITVSHEGAVPSYLMPDNMESTLVFNWYLPPGLAVEQTSVKHEKIRIDGRLRDYQLVREERILDFSTDPIDPALFEVPHDFRKVKFPDPFRRH